MVDLVSYLRHVHLFDAHGDPIEASQVRTLLVCEPFRLVGATFEGAVIDTKFWTSAVSGAAAANTQATGLITSASGTANSGYAQMQSVRKGRFIFAHPHICRKIVRIPTVVVAENTRRWGAFTTTSAPTPTDGFWFELSPAGVLSVNSRNAGGTVNSVASGSFNGEGGTSYTVNTNVHAYEIHYYVAGVEFLIDNVRIHVMAPTTTNLSSTYTLPVCWNSSNSGAGTTSGTMEVWSANMVREGRERTAPTYFFQAGTTAGVALKLSAGELRAIVLSNITNTAVVTLYDNTTAAAPTIWASGPLPNNTVPLVVNLEDIQFFTGLTLAITAAACDALVVYE